MLYVYMEYDLCSSAKHTINLVCHSIQVIVGIFCHVLPWKGIRDLCVLTELGQIRHQTTVHSGITGPWLGSLYHITAFGYILISVDYVILGLGQLVHQTTVHLNTF
jgi:hypothetical protein